MELREMIQRRFPDLSWPLEYRTLAADDLMISAATGRPTVTISAHQDVTLDDRPLFEACEEVFRSYDGRPHWGKVHYQSGAELAELYPLYQAWWEQRDRYDPEGLFLTKDLERLRP
jgi:FAD/FMN-containing dehydrogenase